ncbi:hypothetical protein SynA1544_00900 [Synechococcus sp. A15-44]|nr:hypothetical protein SynA1544_00900 [Synechococcus sp. A15-44]
MSNQSKFTDKEKQVLADIATLGLIGVSAFVMPHLPLLGGVLWARDVINRPSK